MCRGTPRGDADHRAPRDLSEDEARTILGAAELNVAALSIAANGARHDLQDSMGHPDSRATRRYDRSQIRWRRAAGTSRPPGNLIYSERRSTTVEASINETPEISGSVRVTHNRLFDVVPVTIITTIPAKPPSAASTPAKKTDRHNGRSTTWPRRFALMPSTLSGGQC
jgi:hypothetical protein